MDLILRTIMKSIYPQTVWLLMVYAALHDHRVSAQFSGLQEQAIIVGYRGDLTSTLQNATTISLVCVAFGLPSPQITWQSHDPISTDLNYTVNISEFVTLIETNGTQLNYTISVLEFCNVSSSTELTSYTCIAINGIKSDTPIGEFNRTFLTVTDSVTMGTVSTGTPDPVTMTTKEVSDPVTMRTNTTSSPTVSSSVSMTTVIIVVVVIVCVVVLSTGMVFSTLIVVLALRGKEKVSKQRSDSGTENLYRVYNNSLYGDHTEEQRRTRKSAKEQRRTRRSTEELYTCEAYSTVPVPTDHEYAYVAPLTALARLNPSAAGNDISLYPCAAYDTPIASEMEDTVT